MEFCDFVTMVLLLSLLVICSFYSSWAFNLDEKYRIDVLPYRNSTRQPGNSNMTQFGFSLAFYNRTYPPNTRTIPIRIGLLPINGLLIGAPNGTSYSNAPRKAELNSGAVYFCRVPRNGESPSCTPLSIDPNSTNMDPNFQLDQTSKFAYSPYRNHSLLGFTVVSQSQPPYRAMVCAPRWSNMRWIHRMDKTNLKLIPIYLVSGMCYLSAPGGLGVLAPWTKIRAFNYKDRESSGTTLKPNVSVRSQLSQNLFDSAQSGFAAVFLPGAEGVVLTAPGFRDGFGTVAHIDHPEKLSKWEENPTEILYSKINQTADFCADEEEQCYLGFSVSSGRIFGPHSSLYFVSGMPRAKSSGMVVVYTRPGSPNTMEFSKEILPENLDPEFYLQGGQYGESFGYSVIVLDLNNDGWDDIVVGAPFFSSGLFDTDEGAVYVFISSESWKQNSMSGERPVIRSTERLRITGQDGGGSRFGITLSKLGDLDKDGYQDFAIGSPFGAAGGSAYIVYGDANGYRKEISRIKSPDKSRGFAWAIAEGNDVTGDHINDVAVGDFRIGKVYIFRGQPVLTWELSLDSRNASILLKGGSQSVFIRACLVGRSNASSTERALVNVRLLIDHSDGATPPEFGHDRAVFAATNSDAFVFNHTSGDEACLEDIKIIVYGQLFSLGRTGNRPLSLTVKTMPLLSSPEETGAFCPECFISRPEVKSIEIPFVFCLELESRISCRLNGSVSVNGMSAENRSIRIIQGINLTIVLRYDITNAESSYPAFLPKFYMHVPDEVAVLRIDHITTQHNLGIERVEFNASGNFTVVHAWLPVGSHLVFLPGQQITLDVTLNVSSIVFGSQKRVDQLKSEELEIYAGLLQDSIDLRNDTKFCADTRLTAVATFAVEVAAESRHTPDLFVKNYNTALSEMSLEFQVRSTGLSAVPAGQRLLIEIPSGATATTSLTLSSVQGTFASLNGSNLVITCFLDDNVLPTVDGQELFSSTVGSAQHQETISSNSNITTENQTDKNVLDTHSQKLILDCMQGITVCSTYSCDLPAIPVGGQFVFSALVNVHQKLLQLKKNTKVLEIFFKASARISGHPSILPAGISDASLEHRRTIQLTTSIKIYLDDQDLPWLWIILGGCGGALFILVLIAAILWRTEFFVRRRGYDDVEIEEELELSSPQTESETDNNGQSGFLVDEDFQNFRDIVLVKTDLDDDDRQ